MAKRKPTTDESRAQLFEHLREAKASIVRTTVGDTEIEAKFIEPAFDQVLDLVAKPQPSAKQLARWREEGVRLARAARPRSACWMATCR